MNKKRILALVSIAIILAAGVGGVLYANNKSDNKAADKTTQHKSSTTPTKTQTATKTNEDQSNPVGMTANVSHFDAAGFLLASYSRKLTDFSPWQESPVSSKYADFNSDGVDDVFVWAKIPGTKGYSFAAVWTIGSNDQPKELWYLPESLYIPQSDWTLGSNNSLVNSGKNEDNSVLVHSFHWQKTTTGSGFVLEPNM